MEISGKSLELELAILSGISDWFPRIGTSVNSTEVKIYLA